MFNEYFPLSNTKFCALLTLYFSSYCIQQKSIYCFEEIQNKLSQKPTTFAHFIINLASRRSRELRPLSFPVPTEINTQPIAACSRVYNVLFLDGSGFHIATGYGKSTFYSFLYKTKYSCRVSCLDSGTVR
jgi:hypothetical protein